MRRNLPSKVNLQEVSLRDGLQNEKFIVPTDEKIKLIETFADCGLRQIEVSSFVNPRLVPQMADAEELWKRIKRREGIRYTALILSGSGLDRAIESAVPHVGIFVSASETHSRKNSRKTVEEAAQEAERLILRAKSAGIEVRAGVMNSFGCAYEGDVPIDQVVRLVDRLLSAGPAELCLADSSGLGHPMLIKEVLAEVRKKTGDLPLALHLHNTRGLGLANLFSALEEGVMNFDTSLGGLGGCPFIKGAKGNIASEDTILMLHEMGIETGIDLTALIKASLDFEKILGQTFPSMVSHLCEAQG